MKCPGQWLEHCPGLEFIQQWIFKFDSSHKPIINQSQLIENYITVFDKLKNKSLFKLEICDDLSKFNDLKSLEFLKRFALLNCATDLQSLTIKLNVEWCFKNINQHVMLLRSETTHNDINKQLEIKIEQQRENEIEKERKLKIEEEIKKPFMNLNHLRLEGGDMISHSIYDLRLDLFTQIRRLELPHYRPGYSFAWINFENILPPNLEYLEIGATHEYTVKGLKIFGKMRPKLQLKLKYKLSSRLKIKDTLNPL